MSRNWEMLVKRWWLYLPLGKESHSLVRLM